MTHPRTHPRTHTRSKSNMPHQLFQSWGHNQATVKFLNLGHKKLCCNSPKIQTKRPNLMVFCQKHANGKANSKDPDPRSSLIWVCTVCPYLSVRKFRIIMVNGVNSLVLSIAPSTFNLKRILVDHQQSH